MSVCLALAVSLTLNQVQLLLIIVGSSHSLSIDGRMLLHVLNRHTPPAGLLQSARRQLPKIHRLFPHLPVWITLIRWGLEPRELPQHVRVAESISLFQESLAKLAQWHAHESVARRLWYGRDLIALLTKLLSSAPDFHELVKLVGMTWTIDNSTQSSVAPMGLRPEREPRRPPGVARTESAETAESLLGLTLSNTWSIEQLCTTEPMLQQAKNNAWERCMDPFLLSDLISVHAAHPELVAFIRAKATDVNRWDGTKDFQLKSVVMLGFDHNQSDSRALMRNLLNQARNPAKLQLFPCLLQLLASSVLSDKEVSQLTVRWVTVFLEALRIQATSACTPYSQAVAKLYHLIHDEWTTWTDRRLTTAVEALRAEMVGLHRKQGLGGGMMLMEVVRILGDSLPPSFASSAVFQEWLLPEALRKYFEERCIDQNGAMQTAALQSGENANKILAALTYRIPQEVDALVVPSVLCETALLCLLDVLEPAVPQEDMALLSYLLARDQATFWPRILRLTQESSVAVTVQSVTSSSIGNVVSKLCKHVLLVRIRNTVATLAEQLRTRSITLKRASTLLPESYKDKHHTLWLYLREAVPNLFFDEADTRDIVERVRHEICALHSTYDALEHFRVTFCRRAPDLNELTREVQRVIAAAKDTVTLEHAMTEEHWGVKLSPLVRKVAESTYRLRNSLLFLDQWQLAERRIAGAETDNDDQTDDLDIDMKLLEASDTSRLVTEVYPSASNAFQSNCKRMLNATEPITLSEVAHIFGTPLKQADADALEASLPTELSLMFQGDEPTPDEQRTMLLLHDQLRRFANFRRTLMDASALKGFVTNVVDAGTKAADSEVQKLAEKLVTLGQLNESGKLCSTRPLRELSDATERFYELLLPTHKEALSAADQIGRMDAREVLNFVRDLDDHDLRDLMDSGSDDKSDVVDAMSSLARAYAILRPMLRNPPSRLIGSDDAALEVLGAAMRVNHNISGVDLASDVETCIANFHAFTHRNKGMGDQAKDSIRAIVESGTFVFHHGNLEVRCGNGRQPFDAVKLSDLRSHALLGLGARSKDGSAPNGATSSIEARESDAERRTTEHFLQLIAASESIVESLAELRMLGHFGVYELSLQTSTLAELQEIQSAKAQECDQWRKAVQEARDKYYLLSFFASRQLYELYLWECGSSDLHLRQSKLHGHLLRLLPCRSLSAGNVPVPVQPVPVPVRSGPAQTQAGSVSECIDLVTPPSTPEPDDEVRVESDDFAAGIAHSKASPRFESIDAVIRQLNLLGDALTRRFSGARSRHRTVNGWQRRHPPLVGAGTVCFVRRSNVLETMLSLYAIDGELPEHCQVFFCSADTTHEEVQAFLHRAFHSEECPLMRGKLFCILRIGELSESVYIHLRQSIERFYETVRYQAGRTVRLVLICNEYEQHRVSNEFATFVREVEIPQILQPNEIKEAIRGQRHIVVVTSERAGLGKTQTITALARERKCALMRTVLISGHTTRDELVKTMLEALQRQAGDAVEVDALHLNLLDVPKSCANEINDMIFEMLCLGMISSSATSSDSLAIIPCASIFIELANTVNSDDDLLKRVPILSFFEGPSRVHMRWDPSSNPFVLSPTTETDTQIVCRYLQALDNNTVQNDVAEQPQLTASQCWAILDRHFIHRLAARGQQPSFAQLHIFIAVLADQMRRFQESGAFMAFIVHEVGQPNVRAVVTRCLIEAAARFAIRSIGCNSGVTSSGGSTQERVAQQLQVQSFESVDYMLLLMQKDMAITVFPGPAKFGQVAAELKRYYDAQRQLTGQMLAPLAEWREIPQKLPDDQLRGGRTDLLNELINFLGADVRREQLRREFLQLRYTLTADNALKMMLVHVRICAGQPVVICGETGCGKTSLIKFLLKLLGKVLFFVCVEP